MPKRKRSVEIPQCQILLSYLVLETSGTLYAKFFLSGGGGEKESARDIGEGRRRKVGYSSESWWTGAAPARIECRIAHRLCRN